MLGKVSPRNLQGATVKQELDTRTDTSRVTEEDFNHATRSPNSGTHTDLELQGLKELVVGQPVSHPKLTMEQLQASGYSSWPEYVACGLMRAW